MKRKFSILALLVAIATTAMAEVAIGTQVSVSELENGAVYTIQGYRDGTDRYMYYNGSTYDEIHTTTAAYTGQVNYQWSIHKSASGTYYLYNLGAARFIGSVSGNNANIPLVAGGPVSKNFLVKESKVTGKGNVIMMTSDNGGSAMHVGNSGIGRYRIINWDGAYVSKEAEAVCAFKVVKVAEMNPALLNDLTAAVNLYENPAPVYNLADGEYNAREDNNQWRNGWTSTNAEKPSFALTAGANNVNANSTTYIGLRPGSGGCTYSFSSDQIILSIRFEAQSASSTGHTITIGGEATSVGSLWKEFVIENVYNSIASFHLGGDNGADCYVRNIQVVFDDTPAPVKQDLYNTSKGDGVIPPYRIPGITTAHNGRLITAAAELVCGTDPGFGEVDIVCRYSDNNGETWSDMIKVADGTGEESAERNIFETAFGDPAIVADRTSSEVLVVAVAGCTKYLHNNTTRQNPNMIATIHSTDNGETWGTPVDVTEPIYSLFDSGNPMDAAFVGGGKLFQSRIVKVGQYYRLYAAMCARPNGNRVIYSDDFGRTWHALGGASALPTPSNGNEPKCEELPDGRVILSSRVSGGGGRFYNIYTYTNTATGEGSWGTPARTFFEESGQHAGGNTTNGEILIVPVQRNSDSKEMYLALQSLPTGSGRSNVGIFYKELTDVSDINSVANFATGWDGFYQVSHTSSAYSSMDLQADNRIGFIYEETLTGWGTRENPVSTCFPNGEGVHPFDGFDNIYVAYPLEYITGGEYSINREVNRRDYLQNYYTALTADASDEVKAAMATALSNLSAEPTTAEVDNLNFLLTIAEEGDDTWHYIRFQEKRSGSNFAVNSWAYLGDNLQFSATQLKSDAQLWKKVPVGDGTFHIVSKTGKYLVPASTISTSTTQPTQSWSIEASETNGLDVIYNGSVPCQVHALKTKALTNWGYNSLGDGTGARKNDAGCNFEFVEAAKLSDLIFFDGDAGKVGYYTDEVIATYKEAAAGAMTAAEVEEAKAVVLASTERNMPVSGKAYTFKNVQKDGTTVCWFTYGSGQLTLTTDESKATPFVCRLLENGKYVFVCNDGKYLAWRGTSGTGVRDVYDNTSAAYTDVEIRKMTTGDYIDSDQTNTCYVNVFARRGANDIGCLIVRKNDLTFNNSNSPYYQDGFSSAILMEEATYANTPKLNGVGEGELLSANLHNKYMGTFSAPFPTIVPEGVTAYYATEGKGYVTLNAIATDNAIAANTGVILVGEDAGNAVMVPAAAETVATTEGNLLAHSAGAVKDMTGVENAYKFANGNQGMGFYKFSGGTLPMNEAYLQIDDEKEAIGIRFVVECAIGAYKIATFYANDAMNIPSGVRAYVATSAPVMDGENGIITMTEIKDGIIPAKTGAVLRGEPGDYTFEPATEARGTEVTGNLLHGYAGTAEYETVDLPTDGSVNYVLTVMDGNAGFYRKNAGFKVYNNKAYLNVPESNGQARALYFDFDNDATGIVETENESEKTEIYDLAGRRVQKVQKGLYIVNGKKVLK